MRQAISAPDAPKAMGAYSPAVRAGNLLFISGQIPIDPATGELVSGSIAAEAEQVMVVPAQGVEQPRPRMGGGIPQCRQRLDPVENGGDDARHVRRDHARRAAEAVRAFRIVQAVERQPGAHFWRLCRHRRPTRCGKGRQGTDWPDPLIWPSDHQSFR